MVAAAVAAQRGAVMQYAGDAVLATSDAVADALRCSVTVQRDITDAARDSVSELRDLLPKTTMSRLKQSFTVAGEQNLKGLLEGLSEAGLAE